MSSPTVKEVALGNLGEATAMNHSTSALRTVLLAGCAAATIDIVFAFVFFGWTLGITPVRVLQSVATGWYGRASFEGGLTTAAVGLASHFFILIVAAWFYYLASRRLPLLNRAPLAGGIAFGIAIYIAMTFVIVPLSATPARALTLSIVSVGQFLIHPVIGIAIAIITRGGAPDRVRN
jgi:Na+/phosphate symporter